MDSKIEQVKKILYQGYLTDIAAEKINALYQSEPLKQVVSKPEQMMICPLADKCPKKKAKEHDYCCHKGQHPPCVSKFDKTCPACIPVPSTPASEVRDKALIKAGLNPIFWPLKEKSTEDKLRDEIAELKRKIEKLEGK